MKKVGPARVAVLKRGVALFSVAQEAVAAEVSKCNSEHNRAEPEGRNPVFQQLEHQGRFADVADGLGLSNRLAQARRLAASAGRLYPVRVTEHPPCDPA